MLLLALALQVAYPPSTVSPADLAAAQAAAQAAQDAIPPVCTVVMPQDTYTGSVGTQAQCTPRRDATRPTQVQSTSVVTGSDGSFSGPWPIAFATAPAYAHAEIYATSTPYICQINTATVSGYTGKCYQVISTTLPGTLLALGGLVVSPVSSVAAGLTVKVIARQ